MAVPHRARQYQDTAQHARRQLPLRQYRAGRSGSGDEGLEGSLLDDLDLVVGVDCEVADDNGGVLLEGAVVHAEAGDDDGEAVAGHDLDLVVGVDGEVADAPDGLLDDAELGRAHQREERGQRVLLHDLHLVHEVRRQVAEHAGRQLRGR
eukprot:1288039-Rhodomonas_salina.1